MGGTKVKTGLVTGIVCACVGFLVRFNAHDLSIVHLSANTFTYDPDTQQAYAQSGLAIFGFALALLLVVAHRWLAMETDHKKEPLHPDEAA